MAAEGFPVSSPEMTGGLATAVSPNKLPEAASPDDRSWQDYANCLGVDPDLFFPERGASTRRAKEICRGCGVREQCLEYAIVNGEKFGVWGGTSERERRRIRRQRLLAREVTSTALSNSSDVGEV